MKTPLIGLMGYKQSGKSTAASHLEKRGFTRINFKDALVQELKDNFPDLLICIQKMQIAADIPISKILEVELDTNDYTLEHLFEQKPPLVRALMQNYGTDVRRKDKDSYWLDKWEAAYCAVHPTPTVCDDVRFLNEAETIRKYGGIIVKIEREDITSGGTHQSETEQDQIVPDYTISCAEGEHEKLYTELDRILEANSDNV